MTIIIKGSGTGKLGPSAGCRTCESYQDLPCGNSKLAIIWPGNSDQQGIKISGLGTTYGRDYFSATTLCGSATYFIPSGHVGAVLVDCSSSPWASDLQYIMLVDLWAAYAASVWVSSVSLGISINGNKGNPNPPVVRCGWVDIATDPNLFVLQSQGVCKAFTAATWANTCATITNLAGTLTVMDDGSLSIV